MVSHAAIVGPKEGEGPFKGYFDEICADDKMGEDSFEKSECLFLQKSIQMALERAGLNADQVSFLLSAVFFSIRENLAGRVCEAS